MDFIHNRIIVKRKHELIKNDVLNALCKYRCQANNEVELFILAMRV